MQTGYGLAGRSPSRRISPHSIIGRYPRTVKAEGIEGARMWILAFRVCAGFGQLVSRNRGIADGPKLHRDSRL